MSFEIRYERKYGFLGRLLGARFMRRMLPGMGEEILGGIEADLRTGAIIGTAAMAGAELAGQNGSMSFKARLFRYPVPGGWTFVRIPKKHAPLVTHPWGRTPVQARVDGHQ